MSDSLSVLMTFSGCYLNFLHDGLRSVTAQPSGIIMSFMNSMNVQCISVFYTEI